MTIGEHVKSWRIAYGMSQVELAKRIGVSKTAMNDLELNRTRDPRFSVMQRIAHVLHASLDTMSCAHEEHDPYASS